MVVLFETKEHERNTIVTGSDKIYTLPIPADEFESRDD